MVMVDSSEPNLMILILQYEFYNGRVNYFVIMWKHLLLLYKSINKKHIEYNVLLSLLLKQITHLTKFVI